MRPSHIRDVHRSDAQVANTIALHDEDLRFPGTLSGLRRLSYIHTGTLSQLSAILFLDMCSLFYQSFCRETDDEQHLRSLCAAPIQCLCVMQSVVICFLFCEPSVPLYGKRAGGRISCLSTVSHYAPPPAISYQRAGVRYHIPLFKTSRLMQNNPKNRGFLKKPRTTPMPVVSSHRNFSHV